MIVVVEFYARYRSTISETELNTAGERILQFAENVAREHYAQRYDDLGITISVKKLGRLEYGSRLKRLEKFLLLMALFDKELTTWRLTLNS